MGRVFDESGMYLGTTQDTRSFGAAVWEFFHPGQVRAEAAAMGKDAPSNTQVWGTAIDDMIGAEAETMHNLGETAGHIAGGAETLGKWLIVALVAYAVLQVADKVPSQSHVKRAVRKVARRHVTRLRRKYKV